MKLNVFIYTFILKFIYIYIYIYIYIRVCVYIYIYEDLFAKTYNSVFFIFKNHVFIVSYCVS